MGSAVLLTSPHGVGQITSLLPFNLPVCKHQDDDVSFAAMWGLTSYKLLLFSCIWVDSIGVSLPAPWQGDVMQEKKSSCLLGTNVSSGDRDPGRKA